VPILIIGALLLIFGVFAMYSVSIYESFRYTLGLVTKELMSDPSNFHYFLEHIEKLVFGLLVCVVVFFIPWKIIKKYRVLWFILTLLALFLVFTPLKLEILGAARWIVVAWQTIQPGEFFKLGFVLFLAWWLLKKIRVLNERQFFLAFLFFTGIFYLIFALMPDFGTILVLALTGLTMFWYAGGRWYYIVLTFGLGVLGLAIIMPMYPYLQVRIENFLHPDSDQNNRWAGWQIKQALIAVGAGGWVGKWYGKWLQKFGYIPFAQNDFIFAAFAEEIGFLGSSVLLSLYFLLAYFFLRRVEYIQDEYDQLVWVGILASIILQVFVHIGVNIKLIPLTGMTLPFMSYGGSALIVNMVQVVLLYKIAYQPWMVLPEKKKTQKLAF
jgi:cell division protein FtsW (lipid II flippase)